MAASNRGRSGSDILLRIGRTPLVPLSKTHGAKGRILAKLEWYNPFGSIKDRAAYWMISEAERMGRLKRGQTIIIEPSSGNTGIALTGIASLMNYRVEVVLPEKATMETKAMIEAMGGKVIQTEDDLCPRVGKGTDQSIALAEAIVLSRTQTYFMPNQYTNEANYRAHYETTGPELWSATGGRIRHFVAGIGTGGTITGVASFLKEKDPAIKIHAVQPQPSHHIQGLRNLTESSVPKVLEKRMSLIDEWIQVSDVDAFTTVRLLAEREKLFVGPSTGAVMHAAIRIASEKSGNCVAIFADDGRKFGSLYSQLGVFTSGEIDSLRRDAKHLPLLAPPIGVYQKASQSNSAQT